MKKNVLFMAVIMLLSTMFFGCTTTSVKKESAAGQQAASGSKVAVNQYYEFSDVLIPGELKMVPSRTSVYRTPGFAAGLLVFQGRIDSRSLASFFEVNMAKDNWKYSAAFKHNPLIMIFDKENRACVIRIQETTFWTNVEVWMAPAQKESVSTIFN